MDRRNFLKSSAAVAAAAAASPLASAEVPADRIAAKKPSCVVWNVDATNVSESIDILKETYLQPPVNRADYASEIPFLMTPGNHESRGLAARHLAENLRESMGAAPVQGRMPPRDFSAHTPLSLRRPG